RRATGSSSSPVRSSSEGSVASRSGNAARAHVRRLVLCAPIVYTGPMDWILYIMLRRRRRFHEIEAQIGADLWHWRRRAGARVLARPAWLCPHAGGARTRSTPRRLRDRLLGNGL